MKYFGSKQDVAKDNKKHGVLLVNLGTPDAPSTLALRAYLGEFLMDPRVIELPRLLRTILVKGLIVNFRSAKSAKNYRSIWSDQGSPLLVNSVGLGDRVAELLGDEYQLAVSMTYGKPSVAGALQQLHSTGVRDLTIIPLYPQYSGSTAGSVFDRVADVLTGFRWVPNLRFINSYYSRPRYISAIANSVSEYWQQHKRGEKLIFSFHGVPEKYITQGDPYRRQCEESAQAIADKLNLNDDDWLLVFQSRFGAQEWLQPYCDETLKALPSKGIKSVDIICPGFSVDCLETLEEIEQENRDYFLDAGGENYNYIPCLNNSQSHAELIADLVLSPDQ